MATLTPNTQLGFYRPPTKSWVRLFLAALLTCCGIIGATTMAPAATARSSAELTQYLVHVKAKVYSVRFSSEGRFIDCVNVRPWTDVTSVYSWQPHEWVTVSGYNGYGCHAQNLHWENTQYTSGNNLTFWIGANK